MPNVFPYAALLNATDSFFPSSRFHFIISSVFQVKENKVGPSCKTGLGGPYTLDVLVICERERLI